MRGLLGLMLVTLCTTVLAVDETYSYLQDKELRRQTEERIAVAPLKRARQFTVSLDDPPETRWHHVAPLYAKEAQAVTAYLEEFLPAPVIEFLERVAADLTGFFPRDYAAEMKANAKDLNLTVGEIVLVNLIYVVEHVSNSCNMSNTTGPCPPPKSRGPGMCTSIVAETPTGGIVHGRNLDWSIPDALRNMMVDVVYTRGGKVAFIGSQPVGFAGILHGTVPGVMSYSMDAREKGGDIVLNLVEMALGSGARTPTQHARMVLESATSFEEGVAALAGGPIVNPAYYICGGVSKGEAAVISRGRERAVDVWRLSDRTGPDDWFLLQTNYDHWEAPPVYDDRRDPGDKHMEALGKDAVSEETLLNVLRQWPTFNHHTDFTALISAGDSDPTSAYRTYLWSE